MADDKQKAKIVRHFLLNSPPGQFSNVERDLKTLLEPNDSRVLQNTLPAIAKRYNEEQLLVVTVPGTERKTLVSKVGAVGSNGNEYYDPNTNSVFEYDHAARTAQNKREPADGEGTPADAAAFREEAQKHLDEYVKEYYPDGVGVVFATAAEGGFLFTACISASKANLGNRWSGRVRGLYTTTLSPGAAQAEVSSDLSIKVHYFEDGNVQLNTSCQPNLTCSGASSEEFGKTFVDAIHKSEQDYHTQLHEAFVHLSEKTFKNLRRKLPLSGVKFDFDNWVKYSVEGEINRAK